MAIRVDSISVEVDDTTGDVIGNPKFMMGGYHAGTITPELHAWLLDCEQQDNPPEITAHANNSHTLQQIRAAWEKLRQWFWNK